MTSVVLKLATCNLNQWSLDFDGNLARIKESILRAKQDGCRFRLGPELEIPGYGCEDHFLEMDTYVHSWASLTNILDSGDLTDNILCDIGMPVIHRDVTYNCRVYVLNRKIIGMRPKMYLANDGNYRETRFFSEWRSDTEIEDHYLPKEITEKWPDHPKTVPFGAFVLRCRDCVIGTETCEELFTPASPHITMSLDGVQIITNGSGSHHQLRKLDTRINLMKSATDKCGGVYMYANHLGCDGGRLFYDGSSMIWKNGQLLAQGSQFGMLDVEVVTAVVNLQDVRTHRAGIKSRSKQAADNKKKYLRVEVDFEVRNPDPVITGLLVPTPVIEPRIHDPMEEIAYGPSTWLWDYLRRSGMRGYFLPLSGGADSSSTAMLVGIMCFRLFEHICPAEGGVQNGNQRMLAELRKLIKKPEFVPQSGRHICEQLFFSAYMASGFSGQETRRRAVELSKLLGANHYSINIDKITDAVKETFGDMSVHPTTPSNEQSGEDSKLAKRELDIAGSPEENIALQNIQARSRMVMSYFFAQLLPWSINTDPNNRWPGSLLVLGSANVDEALRGYFTKYDCSSADINPIGGIKKVDLREFLFWCHRNYGISGNTDVLKDTAEAAPSAELTGAEGEQSDEVDMGMSYLEMGELGTARKCDQCGPVSTWEKMMEIWWHSDPAKIRKLSPSKRRDTTKKPYSSYADEVGQKVKDFFFFYAINRHKMTTITPAYHAENYSPDDNRFDLRPFLYPATFPVQFKAIDDAVLEWNRAHTQ